MEYKLYEVADAIMDSAAEEYLQENLSSYQAVQSYARNGMNTELSSVEAQLIKVVCDRMRNILASGKIPSTHEWYILFEMPLKEV